MSCGNLLVLLPLMLMAQSYSGAAAEKLATCCTTVSPTEITEPIIDYLVQKPKAPCVRAVIFQTETGLYCSHAKAPWVHRKIAEFRKNKAKSQDVLPPVKSTVSLLSILTSTTAPSSSVPSSSLAPSSSSSSSPVDKRPSE